MSKQIFFESVKLGGKVGDLVLKNRVVLAPLTRSRNTVEGVTGFKWNIDYYTQRADAGLIISEATHISNQAQGFYNSPGIYTPDHVAGWKKVIDAVHEKDGKIFIQLWHMGRVTHSSYHGLQPVSASAIRVEGKAYAPNKAKPDYETPRALTTEEIPSVVEEYRHAAAMAKEAGADGVEIHGANGYLIDQFLQSVSNVRTDKYGGSVENRFRFLKEIIEAVKTVYPPHRIGVRFSPNGNYNAMGGSDNHESFTYFISQLENSGLAYVHVMDGLGFGYHGKDKVFRLADARKVYSGVLIGNCGYSVDTAQGALETGVVDAIAFGRTYMANPDLVSRIKNNYPIVPLTDYSLNYDFPEGHPERGYSDYPTYEESQK